MTEKLVPAVELAAKSPIRHPGESDAYRAARQKLLVEEYELRRHLERVAEMRRALPPGAPIAKRYRFVGERGEVGLADLFGEQKTLIAYSYMFGPARKNPCPMCSSLMSATALRVRALRENTGIAFMARSPIARLVESKRELGMPDLPVFSDPSGEYTRDWVSREDADIPALNVFVRDGDAIRHFWSAEMTESDPGQDPRGAPDIDPLWTLLDILPQGRRPDWYPSLDSLR